MIQKWLSLFCLALVPGSFFAAEPVPEVLSEENFSSLQGLIKPQAGESLWRHVPWETDLTAARRKAAEQGKPLLIWAGGGSAPLGGC